MEEGKHKDLTVTHIPQYKETKATEGDKPFVASSFGPASSTSKPSKSITLFKKNMHSLSLSTISAG